VTIARSAAELLARASSRERVVPADARSGAVFERVVVGSDRYFVKRFGFASDWIMRASGDRVCRQYLVWQASPPKPRSTPLPPPGAACRPTVARLVLHSSGDPNRQNGPIRMRPLTQPGQRAPRASVARPDSPFRRCRPR
jgi:hypothetical protein